METVSSNPFKAFGQAAVKGDVWTKLSLFIWGAGALGRKQYIKAVLLTLIEVCAITALIQFGVPYLSKFDTLGDVEREVTREMDPDTWQMVEIVNDYDNSQLILIYGVCSILTIVGIILYGCLNLVRSYELQLRARYKKHINSFTEDVRSLKEEKFYKVLLSLPVLGVLIFTVVPIICLIFVAFTNYDSSHLTPSHLFTWVGIRNFKILFTSMGGSFSYAFRKILSWTIIWSIFATLTTYFGGIFMAQFLNSPKTHAKKLWRTLLVVTIAVPQFVSLLLVRYFFQDTGIVNTICSNIGLTGFLHKIGLVRFDYIPFLSSPGWAKVTIILINIWIGIPYQMLIATGVLMNIPSDLMESAKIDGANKFQIFRKITMPYMLFVTGPALLSDFVKNFNNFNVIYLLTDSVYKTTDQTMSAINAKEVDLLVTWLFRLTQDEQNYKIASVISIIVFIICASLTLVGFSRMISGDKEGDFQ